MQLTSLILEQIDREAELTRRALEQVPDNKNEWKPHPKSMPLGQLAHMVATMPSWISMIVKQDELDINPRADPATAPSAIWARSKS
jgi:DNA topoisomerase VI subunit B